MTPTIRLAAFALGIGVGLPAMVVALVGLLYPNRRRVGSPPYSPLCDCEACRSWRRWQR